MKKYVFNVFVAGVVATQAVGFGVNEDDGMLDACLNMKVYDVPEEEIEDVVLASVEFVK